MKVFEHYTRLTDWLKVGFNHEFKYYIDHRNFWNTTVIYIKGSQLQKQEKWVFTCPFRKNL